VKVMKDNDNLEEMRYYMEETLIPAYMKPRCYCIPILLMSQFCLMFGHQLEQNKVCCSYYTLSLWFPELVTRHEMFFHVPHGMQSAPPNCMLGASPAYLGQHPLLILPRANSSDEVQLADDNPCLRGGGNLIYIRMLLVAFTCLPATVWLILHVDILGRKFFVGKATGVALVLGFSQLGVILGDLALVLQLNISCVFLETILALFII
ncbi:unnamed protein product, partial [Timema podura]|nr:unnamed protein product [Timema podura]